MPTNQINIWDRVAVKQFFQANMELSPISSGSGHPGVQKKRKSQDVDKFLSGYARAAPKVGYDETRLPPAASGKFSAIRFASTGHKTDSVAAAVILRRMCTYTPFREVLSLYS